MASFIYDSAREKFLIGDLSWTRDDIRVALLKSIPNTSLPSQPIKYLANEAALETHTNLTDLPLNNIVSTSGTIYNKTFSKGVAGGDAVVFNDIPSGIEITSVIVYKKGLNNLQSYLIAHLDAQITTDASQQVTIQWNVIGGKSWIFRI